MRSKLAQVASKPVRKTVGELGAVSKAKDAKGHGSEKRGEGGGMVTNQDTEHTYGGYKKVTIPKGTPVVPASNLPADSSIKYWIDKLPSHLASNDEIDSHHRNYGFGVGGDEVDSHKEERYGGTATQRRQNAREVRQNQEYRNSVGKSLGFLNALQGLAKAKDAKGHGSEKRGGSGGANETSKINPKDVDVINYATSAYGHLLPGGGKFSELAGKVKESYDLATPQNKAVHDTLMKYPNRTFGVK